MQFDCALLLSNRFHWIAKMAPKEAKTAKKEAPKEAPKEKKEAPKEKKEGKEAPKEKEPKAEGGSGKAPPKPDEAEFKSRLDGISDKISEKKVFLLEISGKINLQSEGKEAYEAEKAQLYERMNVTKQKRDEVISERKKLKDGLRENQQKKREMEKQVKQMERDVDDQTEEGILKQIAKMEMKMNLTTMDLKTEKSMMRDMKILKKKIPEAAKNARQLEEMKAAMANGGGSDIVSSVADKVSSLDEEISKLKGQHQQEYEAIQALKEGRNGKVEGVKEWIEKKTAIKGEMDELMSERQRIYDEKKAMQKKFNEWEKAVRLEKQRIWREQEARSNAEWQAEAARKELERPNPYLDEITLIDQTIDYCRNLLPSKEDAFAKEDAKEVDFNNPEGAKILLNKKDREKEMYFAASKSKKAKKQKDTGKKVVVKHTADTFAIFDQLKMPAPMSTEDIPSILEKLEKNQNEVKGKIKKWEEERDAKISEQKKLEATAAGTIAGEDGLAGSPVAAA